MTGAQLGEYAMENQQPILPTFHIDSLAPDFEARSTLGRIRLSDFRGKWVLLFSHPADFTPVCTSEFVQFQKQIEDFDRLNCQLIGLSVDSVHSHVAWLRSIESEFGVSISFPILEDVGMNIGRAYGMINDQSLSTSSMRSCFFIDPNGFLRALMHYPMQVGRSVPEMVRLLSALVETTGKPGSCTEGWQPGDGLVGEDVIRFDQPFKHKVGSQQK